MGCAQSNGYTRVTNVEDLTIEDLVGVDVLVEEDKKAEQAIVEIYSVNRKIETPPSAAVEEEEEDEGFGLLGFVPPPKIHRKSKIMLVDSTDLPDGAKGNSSSFQQDIGIKPPPKKPKKAFQ